jgi:hypothetical protein
VQNDFVPLLVVSYELDIAGRVRRTVESAEASADQSAADLENTRLLLGADLATAYFNMRATDIELDVLDRSIALQRRALDFISACHDLGAASGLEVAQQQALLDTTLTQVTRRAASAACSSMRSLPWPARPRRRSSWRPTSPRSSRRPCRWAFLRRAADPTSPRPSGRWRPQTRRSASPVPRLEHHDQSRARLRDALAHQPVRCVERALSFGAIATQLLLSGGRLKPTSTLPAPTTTTVANYRRVVLAMQEVEDGITGLAALRATGRHAPRSRPRARCSSWRQRYRAGRRPSSTSLPPSSRCSRPRAGGAARRPAPLTSVFLIKALGGDWQGPG